MAPLLLLSISTVVEKRVGESAEFTSSLQKNSWSPSIHWNVNYGKSRQLIFPFTDGVFLFHKKFYYILTGRWREWRDTIEERRHIRFWELSFQVNWWEKSINRGRILSFRCVRDKHRHMAALVYAHIHSLSPYLPASMAFVERRESKKEVRKSEIILRSFTQLKLILS